MSDVDRTAAGSPTAVTGLPTGTVTLLVAGVDATVERGDDPAATMAQLDRTLYHLVAAHHGVRVPADAADSVVVAFARASDALACAVALQQAAPSPIRLRIGVHTGEVPAADDIGVAIGRAAGLRDLARGGETLLSSVTEQLVAGRLPPDTWILHVSTLPGAARVERVGQLCHRDLATDGAPLGVPQRAAGRGIPLQLTSLVGRDAELREVRQLVRDNRLVTLTGAGGVGKTRLAAQLAGRLTGGFSGGVYWVDLAPVADPDLVAAATAQTLGLPDQPGGSALHTLTRFIADQQLLLVLDNCEHLLDACAMLVTGMLERCPGLRIVATSREPIGVAGEVTWRTPSLSLTDDAVGLFAARARLVRADFAVTAENAAVVTEICRRLDGIPLAIELAAARGRALSLPEILDGLHDRFRLLTGGARTAVRRQQTLRASVDWSHTLLTRPERALFYRLAVFSGGFDLAAAHAVAGGAELPRFQVLDELSLLVDKSLVVADDSGPTTRYRLLETMRQYALEKLVESGEADTVRARHRDHYTALAAELGAASPEGHRYRIARAETELDNLRAAFAWSRDNADVENAVQLASSLQPLWLRGRILEGLAWFDAVAADLPTAATATQARALADNTILEAAIGVYGRFDQTERALAIARRFDDPALLARVLAACGATCAFSAEIAAPYLAEAVEVARAGDDRWQLSQILRWRALSAFSAGDPITAQAAAEEGHDLAEAIGDRFLSRVCRWHLGLARWLRADLAAAVDQFSAVAAEARVARDPLWQVYALSTLAKALAHRGETRRARAAAETAVATAAGLTAFQQILALGALADAALAAGDVTAAVSASKAAAQAGPQPGLLAVSAYCVARAALAARDLSTARRWADDGVAVSSGGHRMIALGARARVALAQHDVAQAESDARDALDIAAETKVHLTVPDVIECLAVLAADSGAQRDAARLFGAAAALRDRTGELRFASNEPDYAAALAGLRRTLGDTDFDAAWAEGAALSTTEAIACARRGPGRHPANGWTSLTPTELDVAGLVGEGLTNKQIAARLCVSPRTVQTHLTHIYGKLGVASRTQLLALAPQH